MSFYTSIAEYYDSIFPYNESQKKFISSYIKSPDSKILDIVNNGGSSITLLGVKYMIVENTPERIIGTNITGQGHLIFAPFEHGVLVTYIIPQVGPRDALFNVQSFAQKLNLII